MGGWQMIGAVREKERGSEEMLGMSSILCCPVSSLAIAILRRSPREVASSRPLSGHGRRVSQFALVVRVCCCASGGASGCALCHGSSYLQGAISQ